MQSGWTRFPRVWCPVLLGAQNSCSQLTMIRQYAQNNDSHEWYLLSTPLFLSQIIKDESAIAVTNQASYQQRRQGNMHAFQPSAAGMLNRAEVRTAAFLRGALAQVACSISWVIGVLENVHEMGAACGCHDPTLGARLYSLITLSDGRLTNLSLMIRKD